MKEIEKPLFCDLKLCMCTQTHRCVEISLNFKKNILIALQKKKILVSAYWNIFLYIVIVSLITGQTVRTIFSPQCITIDMKEKKKSIPALFYEFEKIHKTV